MTEVLEQPTETLDAAEETMPKQLTVESLADLDKALKKMGQNDAMMRKMQAMCDAEVAKIRERYGKQIDRRKQEYEELEAAAQLYAHEHKDELLGSAKGKTVKRPSGDIQYVAGRETLVLEEAPEIIITRLEQAGMNDLVRTKKEIDKTALMKKRPAIQGVRIDPGQETIKIKPAAAA